MVIISGVPIFRIFTVSQVLTPVYENDSFPVRRLSIKDTSGV